MASSYDSQTFGLWGARDYDLRKDATMLRILILLAVAAPLKAHPFEIRPLLKSGVDIGGETIAFVQFDNGDREKIKGNDGFYLGGGATVLDAPRHMEYHLTLAYKIMIVSAENGDLEFTRFPLEALAFYRFSRVRVGGGPTYHINPKVHGLGLNVEFKNALGLVLQADWLITRKIAFGGRITLLEYEATGGRTGTGQANGFGVAFSINF